MQRILVVAFLFLNLRLEGSLSPFFPTYWVFMSLDFDAQDKSHQVSGSNLFIFVNAKEWGFSQLSSWVK